jgi:hypothetical protein
MLNPQVSMTEPYDAESLKIVESIKYIYYSANIHYFQRHNGSKNSITQTFDFNTQLSLAEP